MRLCAGSGRQIENTFENSLWCNKCDYATAYAHHLKTHLKTHSGEKPHKCNQCDFASVLASNLRRHLRTHSGEKIYKCSQCDFASIQAVHLRMHLKTHSGEKPYKCTQCDFSSAEAGNLRRHLRTHSGEKPSVWLCSYSYRHCHVIWKPTLEKNPEKWFARLIQSLISFFIQGLKNQGPSAFSAVARKFPVLLEKSRGVSIFTLDRRESVFSEVIPCNDRRLFKIGNNTVVLVWPWFSKNDVNLPVPL